MPFAAITFDDVVASQLNTAIPILQKLDLPATFFICDWFRDRASCPKAQGMARKDLVTLHDMGYELGNHSLTHRDPKPLTVSENLAEITGLEQILQDLKLPRPIVYAYPGGPHSSTAEEALRQRNYIGARCTGNLPLPEQHPDPFALPSFAIAEQEPDNFPQAMAAIRRGQNVILTYHGVPDAEHPWCNTEPVNFNRQMTELTNSGATCITLSQLIRNLA